MEQKDRYLIIIFLVVFTVDFMVGIIEKIPIPILVDITLNYYVFINLLLSPFLLFIALYLIGRKFDVRTNLRSLIVILLAGAYLGYFFSLIIVPLLGEYFSLWELVLESIFSLRFIFTFFVAFSALVLANFRNDY